MNSENVTIDNETLEIIEDTIVDKLVGHYNQGIGKTVQGILIMCKAVYDAYQIENMSDQNKFFNNVNLDKSSSTCKKFKAIGEKYVLFEKIEKSLPPAWTSLYELTRLDDEKLTNYINDNKIHSKIKLSKIKELIGDKQSPSLSPSNPVNQKDTDEGWKLNEDTSDLIVHIRIKGDTASRIQDLLKTLNDLTDVDVSVKGNGKFSVVRDLYAVRNGG